MVDTNDPWNSFIIGERVWTCAGGAGQKAVSLLILDRLAVQPEHR